MTLVHVIVSCKESSYKLHFDLRGSLGLRVVKRIFVQKTLTFIFRFIFFCFVNDHIREEFFGGGESVDEDVDGSVDGGC
jgi:hypothetical protein